jgi:hypothetical protein
MTTIEKCKLAIQKGYKYNEESGEVIGVRGNTIKRKNGGYIDINIMYHNKNYHLCAHQFGWYSKYNEIPPIIDHINRDKLDNRIVNLRSVTSQENQFNRGAKGYTYIENRNKYQAQIVIGGKFINLGHFNTPEEATDAYINAKQIYHNI